MNFSFFWVNSCGYQDLLCNDFNGSSDFFPVYHMIDFGHTACEQNCGVLRVTISFIILARLQHFLIARKTVNIELLPSLIPADLFVVNMVK